mmetsp:Transcript_248/g.682  ORF Transcript_248/g.682 Transcript_248/m.682 type:complete len:240 (+) Transcript_248:3-722(+)
MEVFLRELKDVLNTSKRSHKQIMVTEVLVTYHGIDEKEVRADDGGTFDERITHIAIYTCPEPAPGATEAPPRSLFRHFVALHDGTLLELIGRDVHSCVSMQVLTVIRGIVEKAAPLKPPPPKLDRKQSVKSVFKPSPALSRHNSSKAAKQAASTIRQNILKKHASISKRGMEALHTSLGSNASRDPLASPPNSLGRGQRNISEPLPPAPARLSPGGKRTAYDPLASPPARGKRTTSLEL